MIWLAALLVVGLVVCNIAWLYVHEHQQELWRLERRELLTRIQHPQIVVPTGGEPIDAGEPEPDEIGVVGTVQLEGLRRDD